MTPQEKVFISYCSEDIRDAVRLQKELKKAGITCWVSNDSLLPGADYAKVIPKAIRACRIFILILSENAQKSEWVPRELDQAINDGKLILPFMVEKCDLDDQFHFYLSKIQIYSAWKNRQEALQDIINVIEHYLDDVTDEHSEKQVQSYRKDQGTAENPTARENPAPDTACRNIKNKKLLVSILPLIAAVFLILKLTVFTGDKADPETPAAKPISPQAAEQELPETESPETESPETESPEAESPETESPEEEASETDSDAVVTFKDPALQAAIYEELHLSSPGITFAEAEKAESLDLSWKEGKPKITDLSGLSAFTGLEKLNLASNEVKDISELQTLQELRTINLEKNQIEDISPLKNLSQLESIDLNQNLDIKDISSLFALTNVKMLDLRFNHINDLSGISGMVSLKKLYLSNNQISDISPVVGLRELTYLSFNNNAVSDISCLKVLTKLKTLAFNGNNVTDISVLTELPQLKTVQLTHNPIDERKENYEVLDKLKDSVEIEKSDIY